jgi:hypothetical protein
LIAPNFFDAIDVFNMTVNSSGAGTIQLVLAASGFAAGGGPASLILVNTVGGQYNAPVGSTVTFDSFANAANTIPDLNSVGLPDVGTSLGVTGALGGFTYPPAATASVSQTFTVTDPAALPGTPGGVADFGLFGGQVTTNFAKGAGNYSLYAVVTISFTGAGSISFNFITGTLPAPGGLALVLTALPGLGLGYWRRLRKQATVA